jgi:hypothetical protein
MEREKGGGRGGRERYWDQCCCIGEEERKEVIVCIFTVSLSGVDFLEHYCVLHKLE